MDLKLTSAAVAERVEHTRIDAGRVVVMDRGYARVRDFQAVLEAGSDFITRVGWRALRLQDGAGQPVDVIKLLPEDDAPHDHDVWVKSIAQPLRLVIQRLPVEKAERARRKRARKASKSGARLDPRTAQASGYVTLLTSMPRAREPAGAVTACYRNRWQVEIGFKRMKTLGGIGKLPSAEPRLARTWLLAHLIAVVLTDDLANEIVGFPPRSGEPPPVPALLWAAWQKAREILKWAILPKPKFATRADLKRFRRRRAEAPRTRRLQACLLRPP
ncbi:MAG: transposase [Acetobacteraceae bacterium]|nr:transposase [Acetobacteraceae bacterium]